MIPAGLREVYRFFEKLTLSSNPNAQTRTLFGSMGPASDESEGNPPLAGVASPPAPKPLAPAASIPIAIVGMACRFSGDVTSPSQLWELCASGKDGWTTIPESRFDVKSLYHRDYNKVGRSHVEGGYFMNQDISLFDAAFFNLAQDVASVSSAFAVRLWNGKADSLFSFARVLIPRLDCCLRRCMRLPRMVSRWLTTSYLTHRG